MAGGSGALRRQPGRRSRPGPMPAATISSKAVSTVSSPPCAPHAGTCEPAGKCADYIEKNRGRMRYPDFRAQGLCVGSGIVESGCKMVVGSRLKQSGMRWTVHGANAILALRCCVLGGGYEDF